VKKQQGMTLISLILISVLVIGAAIVGIKVVPSVTEYFGILKVIKAIDASGELKGASVPEIRKSFDKRAYIDDIKSISGADLDVSKDGSDIVISFEYSKKIPLYGNVSLCIDYSGSSSSSKGGS
jgi:hypothetical protein